MEVLDDLEGNGVDDDEDNEPLDAELALEIMAS